MTNGLFSFFASVRTARLILRRPSPADAAGVYRIEGDPATNRYNPGGPDLDLAASERRVAEWMQGWEIAGLGHWVARLAEAGPDSAIIGVGGLRSLPWRDRDILNLYYRFTPAAWGHGYATEMAGEAIHLAQAHLSQLPIVARIRHANTPSQAVAVRAGLTLRPDLETEDHLIYALGWL